jgi:diguanylate cyclase (GGDEF)-like protein
MRETEKEDGKNGSLSRTLDQSEQVQGKVEQAAADLSSVNAVLKDEIAGGVPLATAELTLDRSEAIEGQIHEAAEELVAVNDALAEEIDERRDLERRLSTSDAALSESRAAERKSRHSALHDGATGLPNATLFNDRLQNALAQAQRHSRRLAVMFIDLDRFKAVNDTYGHQTGDRVLQMVAKRLQAIVRGGDTVSRRGGDEFLFLMLEVSDASTAMDLARRIVDAIAATSVIDGTTFSVKASVGIALYPEDGLSALDLLNNADTAMYAAKLQKTAVALYGRIAEPKPPARP